MDDDLKQIGLESRFEIGFDGDVKEIEDYGL